MHKITFADYRCFHGPQAARLAPLTLLVGDNSTGKTSFLALIRALWDIAFRNRIADFKESPYDLGSFDEIVHASPNTRGLTAFNAGFRLDGEFPKRLPSNAAPIKGPLQLSVLFAKQGSAPVPSVRRIEAAGHWIEDGLLHAEKPSFRLGSPAGEWSLSAEYLEVFRRMQEGNEFPPLLVLMEISRQCIADGNGSASGKEIVPPDDDWKVFRGMCLAVGTFTNSRLFASAPVRSQPRRTYDPTRLARDSEGQYIPMYLGHLLRSDRRTWKTLKSAIDEFGQQSGLFDAIDVRQLGKGDGDPFQVLVARHGKATKKGPSRNLVDVGYGVSQALPIVTELLRPDGAPMFLLQQPEVHLHPSAQAAMGSLFCNVAAAGQQLIVETHSDHLIDRVRMDVRDGTSKLTPNDVSILFFERHDYNVQIHTLDIDEQGNIVGQPEGYRQFFLDETSRSIGLS